MRVIAFTGAFVGAVIASLALISNSGQAYAEHFASSPPVPAAIPAITGAVTDASAAQQIENVAVKYTVLDQSILDPHSARGTDWPGTTPLLPPTFSADPAPLAGPDGSLSVPPTDLTRMVHQATAAMLAVATVHSDSTWWIKSAVEAQSGQGFQVPSAGSYPTSVQVESQAPSQAVVTLRVVVWQHQIYQLASGSFRSHGLTNQAIWTLTLIKEPSGDWKVDSKEFGFVPGYGP